MLRCKVNTDSNKKKKNKRFTTIFSNCIRCKNNTDYYAPSIIQINIQIRICPNVWHIIENDIFY